MVRGYARATFAVELPGHQKTPIIALMKARAAQPVLATQVNDTQCIAVMEIEHAHQMAIVSEQPVEG